MIDPIQQMLDDIEELMKYRNYQPAIDKITEVLEVGKFNLLNICFNSAFCLPKAQKFVSFIKMFNFLASSLVSKIT